MVNAYHGARSSSWARHHINVGNDFIMMNDFVQDMVDDRGDNDEDPGEVAILL